MQPGVQAGRIGNARTRRITERATIKACRASLEPAQREALLREQREWLAKRDAGCTIYKFWVDCLDEKYNARIAALQAKIDALKKPAAAQATKPPQPD